MNTNNLVFTSAGKNSKHVNYWLNEPEKRNFDLWVVYYPEGEPPHGYADNTELFFQRRGTKYENLAYVYDKFRHRLDKYEAFFIVDDDIESSTLAINKLFEIHARWKLDFSQPAYSLQSYILHPHLVWRPFSTLRFVSFVENGVTIFGREAFHACAPIFREAKSGCGVDHIFPKCIPHRSPRIAVIDEVVCHHRFRQSELDHYYLPRHLQREEGERLMSKYGFDLPWASGLDLRLMSVNSSDELVSKARNLIIVALVGTNIHIRIFNANGKKVIDKTKKSKSFSEEILAAVKKQLNSLPEESGLSQEQKLKIIGHVTSIVGSLRRNLVSSCELKKGFMPKSIQQLLFKLGDTLIWRWHETRRPRIVDRICDLSGRMFASVFFGSQSWIAIYQKVRGDKRKTN